MAGYSTNCLEAFVDTVRLGSFSAVARKRGVTASAIARQVTSLEQELGISLFLRTTRALVLTDAGRTLFNRSERILDDLAEAKAEATSQRKEVSGLLRICCWPTFGKMHILPHLPSLFDRYPRLRIDINLSERLHEPLLERTDLIIRIGSLTDSTLLATRFASHRCLFVASPAYIARHGQPQSLADCLQHRLIDKRHTAEDMGWRSLLGESRSAQQSYILSTDDLEAQASASAAGIGIAHLPDWVVYNRISKGELNLIPLKAEKPTELAGIFLLRNPGPHTAAMEAFCSHLRHSLGTPPIWEQALAHMPIDNHGQAG